MVGTGAEAGLGDMDEPAPAPERECECEFGPVGSVGPVEPVELLGPASVDDADSEAQTESAMEPRDDKRAGLFVPFR